LTLPFDQHPRVSFTTLAGFEMGWMPAVFLKGGIAKHDQFVSDAIDQRLKRRAIADISRIHVPADNQAKVIEQQTQFAANNSAPIRLSANSNAIVTNSLGYEFAWVFFSRRTSCHPPGKQFNIKCSVVTARSFHFKLTSFKCKTSSVTFLN